MFKKNLTKAKHKTDSFYKRIEIFKKALSKKFYLCYNQTVNNSKEVL